jgi:exodeoxyribonuclease V alpha subunit
VEEYTGRISRIRFQNDDGFCIFQMEVKGRGPISCKGTFLGVEVRAHMDITVRGKWSRPHPKYGRSLEVKDFREVEPSDTDGITRYLVANVKGVGWVSAKKIAQHFGEKTVEVLTKDPSRIYECSFLTDMQREMIYKRIQENVGYRDISVFLMSFDVPNSIVGKIYRKLGNQAVEILKEDPYQMMDIPGIGFKKADAIATRMGIDSQAPVRIRAVIRYVLNDVAGKDGHLFATKEQLTKISKELLSTVPRSVFWGEVEKLVGDGEVMVDGARVYATRHYNNEVGAAMRLSEMLTPVDRDIDIEEYLNWYDEAHDITLSAEQREAVRLAYLHKVVVITGLPGTGKTTVSKAIVGMFDRLVGPKAICLMAPTGIASKRLSAATGRPAGTIHRTLGCKGPTWEFNDTAPHPAEAHVVDEFSMLDQSLFHRLLKGIRPDATLVMVGDDAQLPSVGPGNVLRELIKSGVIPTIKLTTIHRQAEASEIVINAHRVNNGEDLIIDNAGDTDFKFLHMTDEEAILERIRRTARALKARNYPFQCLSPRHKGTLGVENLNEKLRDDLNPDTGQPTIKFGYKVFRVGDRVMVTRNNYKHKVFNGDIGTVIQINTKDRTVQFQVEGSREPTTFSSAEAGSDLVLAYCITIHKSQGSEWDIVVMPMVKSFSIQLVRNLFYTAITRAKKKVLVYGQLGAAEKAIRNNKVRHRNTAFAERLRNVVGATHNLMDLEG